MAVYTDVSFEELERLLAGYDIGTPLSFKGIAEGVENSNFYLQTDRGAFILTLYEKRVRPDDLPFFLGLMEHLAGARPALPPAGARPRRPLAGRRLNGRPPPSSPFSPACRCAGRTPPLRRGRRRAGAAARGGRRLCPHPRQCAGAGRLAPLAEAIHARRQRSRTVWRR